MDLAVELKGIYDNEINVEIGWFWHCGIEVRLGDKMTGFLAEDILTSTAEIIEPSGVPYSDTLSQGYIRNVNKDTASRAISLSALGSNSFFGLSHPQTSMHPTTPLSERFSAADGVGMTTESGHLGVNSALANPSIEQSSNCSLLPELRCNGGQNDTECGDDFGI